MVVTPAAFVALFLIGVCGVAGLFFLFGGDPGEQLRRRLAEDDAVKAFGARRAHAARIRRTTRRQQGSRGAARLRELLLLMFKRAEVAAPPLRVLLLLHTAILPTILGLRVQFGFGWLASIALAYGLLLLLMRTWLRYRARARARRFLKMFPNVLDFLVRGVRAGLPLSGQMRLVGDNFEEPIKGVFTQALSFVRLGVPLPEALRRVQDEVDVSEYRLFVIAITVQQQSGGNIGEILSRLAHVMRKRSEMADKLKAQTAQVRSSAYVIMSLPVFLVGIISLLRPGYFDPMLSTEGGHLLMGVAALLLFCAVLFMNFLMRERF